MGICKLQRRMNRKGETLVETLVALLIAALVLTMLVGMVTASTGILQKSKKDLTSYYAAEADMASSGEKSFLKTDTLKIIDEDSNPLTIAGKGTGEKAILVSFYTNTDAKNTPVISYSIKR